MLCRPREQTSALSGGLASSLRTVSASSSADRPSQCHPTFLPVSLPHCPVKLEAASGMVVIWVCSLFDTKGGKGRAILHHRWYQDTGLLSSSQRSTGREADTIKG